MSRKSKRPVFQPTRIDENPDSFHECATPSVYVRSTHYTSRPDGSHRSESEFLNVPTTTESHAPTPTGTFEDFSYLDFDYSTYLSAINSSNMDDIEVEYTHKKRRVEKPLLDWLDHRERFLSEFLCLEGKDETVDLCTHCRLKSGVYQCLDCDGLDLVCQSCCLSIHQYNPLHLIERWDDLNGYFVRLSLQALGQTIQLGHITGEPCINPEPSFAGTFTVLDVNGIHDVTLHFCNCETKQPHYIQLLRYGWFPATVSFPRTAFTLRLLKTFHILSFESKMTVFEHHQALQRLSDNTGTIHLKGRYRHFLRVIREYRHLKMLKRFACGNARDGAAGTSQGECTVLCPACPHPGINLSSGWQSAPPEKRFLYSLFLGMDANFCLKRRYISNSVTDPSLSKGWSYFVEEDGYKTFLEEFGKLVVQEPSRCSNHTAVNNKRGCEGFAASGVGACDCVRHNMKRACSVGDLQKGERYVNMDYLFLGSLSTISDTELIEIVTSYDIMCQYSINLWSRMKIYPQWMHVDHLNNTTFHFLIPKFHLPAHIRPCQTRYSFNYNKYVGRTDGEGIERGWSQANGLATSTREMGPGSRRDTLDDHFGYWNWCKTTRMSQSIVSKVKEAVKQSVEHTERHEEFTKTMGDDNVRDWTSLLDRWEDDHKKFNPFESKSKGLSQDAVRRQLADSEEVEATTGQAFIMHKEISSSRLIAMGLDFEIQQRHLALELKSMTSHATDDQKTKWKLKSNNLRRKITAWILVEHMYIPALYLIQHRATENADTTTEEPPVFSIPLHLPSSISSTTTCDVRLSSIEWDLRHARCTDAIDNLRGALCLRAFVLIDKRRFQRGQRANTHSQGIVDRIQMKVNDAVITYRTGREALSNLACVLGKVGWEGQLPVLLNEDVRTLSEDTPADGRQNNSSGSRVGRSNFPSEGRRTVSWIWTKAGTGDIDQSQDERLHESLRIEWCKSRARRDRWVEELLLLQEEKRRILAFFQARAAQWDILKDGDQDWMLPGVPHDLTAIHGRISFARSQAAQFRRMYTHCNHVWKNINSYIEANGIGVDIVPKDGFPVDMEDPEDDETDSQPNPNRRQ